MVEIYTQLDPKMKEIFLFAMLNATAVFLKKPNSGQKYLVKTLAGTMLEALLYAWIKAR
jgi:hypothetical protein